VPESKAAFVSPMLLLPTAMPPEGPAWSYEVKLHGYREVAMKAGGGVHLRSRNDKDFNGRYPGVVRGLAALPDETVVDGEIVALTATVGRPLTRSRTSAPPGDEVIDVGVEPRNAAAAVETPAVLEIEQHRPNGSKVVALAAKQELVQVGRLAEHVVPLARMIQVAPPVRSNSIEPLT
jgi:bifunctional non-homologous end joining protein LigD